MQLSDNARPDHPAVLAHLQMVQATMSRMALNSANCKAWCVTIVSAILVLAVDKGKTKAPPVAFIPLLVLFVLDAYYLALERTFKEALEQFIGRLQRGELLVREIFSMRKGTEAGANRRWWSAATSFAVWPFYLGLALAIVVVWVLV